MRYGSVSLILTVLVIVAVIILNFIFAILAGRYEWMYADMKPNLIYSISEDCEDYLREHVIPEVDAYNKDKPASEQKKLEILFCDTEENLEADLSLKYILDSVKELSDIFEGYIEIGYVDIWNNPSEARALGVNSTDDVVCRFGDRIETMNLVNFYIFESGNTTSPVAYNGEKILASCLMRVTQEETPVCYLTANHGEDLTAYELIRMLTEAGYDLAFLDLSTSPIPEDCDLLITYNPKQDLIAADGISRQSETEKLDAYMAKGGKYMLFLSADTFVSGGRENMEAFLADWGVKYMHKPGENGIEDCYLVRDTSNSTSVDGYTILSQNATEGIGGQMMQGLPEKNQFGHSTYIAYADGFTDDGVGNRQATVNGSVRLVSPLMLSHESAVAWANGVALSRAAEDPFMLMTVSTAHCENGKDAYLICSASTEFASEDAMQSAVIGNSRTLTGLLKYMGRYNAPFELVFKPFESRLIESLTTREANVTTVILVALPALIAAGLGTFVLVRRKHA